MGQQYAPWITHLSSETALLCPRIALMPEMEAILTHWIQHPDVRPPLMPREIWRRWGQTVAPALEHAVDTSGGLALLRRGARSPGSARFIDLFAGIGGIRLAFESAGGTCVFSSEWDRFAKQTYASNFGEVPYGDIRAVPADEIPRHDILCAGFPCQPFSLAGVSKKNSLGRKHGFEDETQGTLFFDIARIISHHRPRAFFLENVKNLTTHDRGRTFSIIMDTLETKLGYYVVHCVVDGSKWVPQHRERIFICGFDRARLLQTHPLFVIPTRPQEGYIRPELRDIVGESADAKYTLGSGTWQTLERHRAHHLAAGNGFGYGLIRVPIAQGTATRTISARYHKDGAEILVEQPNGSRPRRLTVNEAARLQGYNPEVFSFPVSDTQAYRQIGNSVVVPAVAATAGALIDYMGKHLR